MKAAKIIGEFDLKKSLLVCFLGVNLACFGCGKKADSSQSSGLDVFSSDDTEQAKSIVNDANNELKKIKAIYKDNEGRIEEIQSAMSNRESDKVKKIADDLVFQINDGITLGENAISKLEEAEALNINDTFKEYLRLKEDSLRVQIDAFEFRRQAAQLLSKSSGKSDAQEVKSIQGVFKEKEAEFQKLWQEGRDKSQEANDFYKESLKKSVQ